MGTAALMKIVVAVIHNSVIFPDTEAGKWSVATGQVEMRGTAKATQRNLVSKNKKEEMRGTFSLTPGPRRLMLARGAFLSFWLLEPFFT